MTVQTLPVIVFAFNRPEKLKRVLGALSRQAVDRLIVFVDGPSHVGDDLAVQACRSLARQVDWAETELHFWDENHGLGRLTENIDLVLASYLWAVIVEDDCLPVPGFYEFMRQALLRYQDRPEVFSIGGYQPVRPGYFKHNPYSLVSCARFMCWGWATWRDRWQRLRPDIDGYASLFSDLQQVPEVAGSDMPEMARRMAAGQIRQSWDVQVAIASLARKQVHLIATRGLVRNIGLDRSGIHGGFSSALRDFWMHNRNLVERMPDGLALPETVSLDCDYAAEYRRFVSDLRTYSFRRQRQRGEELARRYLWPAPERLFDLDVPRETSASPGCHALLSYLVYPFSIARQEARYLRHVNIFHAQEIVRALNQMGYSVDVIDYRDRRFRPHKAYDLFIGHGAFNFEKIATQLPEKAKKIYFSTGSYWQFHNTQEAARFAALSQRRGVVLALDRPIVQGEEAALRLADGILGIGNAFTRSTYADFERVAMINGTALLDAQLDWCPKDYQAGRQHFLFFASGGNVHKGLDLVLEAFLGLNLHLWVMAPLQADFIKIYQPELAGRNNIHLFGWTQPRSASFYQVMQRCNFCLLPSCSEGQAQSVIEAMNQGLIPAVSRQAGVDVGDFGVWIDPPGVEMVRQVARTLAGLPAAHCREMSFKARQAAQEEYAEPRFAANFRAALCSLGIPSNDGG
jgi:hypothetical protein